MAFGLSISLLALKKITKRSSQRQAQQGITDHLRVKIRSTPNVIACVKAQGRLIKWLRRSLQNFKTNEGQNKKEKGQVPSLLQTFGQTASHNRQAVAWDHRAHDPDHRHQPIQTTGRPLLDSFHTLR